LYRDHGDQPLHVSVPSSSASDKMAEGCEALVSSLAHSPLKYIAGRCLS
jgi:hypothetical protein